MYYHKEYDVFHERRRSSRVFLGILVAFAQSLTLFFPILRLNGTALRENQSSGGITCLVNKRAISRA